MAGTGLHLLEHFDTAWDQRCGELFHAHLGGPHRGTLWVLLRHIYTNVALGCSSEDSLSCGTLMVLLLPNADAERPTALQAPQHHKHHQHCTAADGKPAPVLQKSSFMSSLISDQH